MGANLQQTTPSFGGDRSPTITLQTTVRKAKTHRRSPPDTFWDSECSTVAVVKLHVHLCQ
ncbi:MAG: hypothetical protein SFY66_00905 [Oculatellaceae cyanobacterium bins.114]|nr:hypothetical protein [Oculatellaceae cyanobacterium bins.114]